MIGNKNCVRGREVVGPVRMVLQISLESPRVPNCGSRVPGRVLYCEVWAGSVEVPSEKDLLLLDMSVLSYFEDAQKPDFQPLPTPSLPVVE